MKGIIDICGEYLEEPHVVCYNGLSLLYSLCDFEQNPGFLRFFYFKKIGIFAQKEAEFYIDLFTKISAKNFAKLGLGKHIVQVPAKNCKKLALKLLELYKEANPQANNFLFSQIVSIFRNFRYFFHFLLKKKVAFLLEKKLVFLMKKKVAFFLEKKQIFFLKKKHIFS